MCESVCMNAMEGGGQAISPHRLNGRCTSMAAASKKRFSRRVTMTPSFRRSSDCTFTILNMRCWSQRRRCSRASHARTSF